MKILIINLERAKDRRETIDKQLNELGLEHQFVPAIDYTLVEEDYINSLRTPFHCCPRNG